MKIPITCTICGKLHTEYKERHAFCSECQPIWDKARAMRKEAYKRARKRSLSFNLTSYWILPHLLRPCPKTGVRFVLINSSTYRVHPRAPSIDRIDSEGGYVQSNCRIVTWWYNAAKNIYSDDEVLELCHKVAQTVTS